MTDIDIEINEAPYQRHVNCLGIDESLKCFYELSYWPGQELQRLKPG